MELLIPPLQNTFQNSSHNATDVFPVQTWLITCYSIISFAGIVGNSLVLIVISTNVQMKTSSFGTYLGALAAADLLVALSCIPVYFTSTSTFKDHPTGIGGDVMCKILSGYNILFFFATVSVYTLVAIALERYFAICQPLSSRATSTPSRAKKIVAGIWLWSLIVGILSIYGEEYADLQEATVGAHCKFSITYNNDIAPKAVYVSIFTVQYILPVCCMIFCFVKIRNTLMEQIRLVEDRDQALQVAELRQLKQRKQTIFTVIIVVVAYFLLWSPNQILYFCFNFHVYETSWDSDIVQASVVLCFFTCCVNPVIYAFRSQQFRSGFKSALVCQLCIRLKHRIRGYTSFTSDTSSTAGSDRRL